jgi:hypothetical protein
MSVSREAVIYGYKFFLGRDPESEQAVLDHMSATNEDDLVNKLLRSKEYKKKNKLFKFTQEFSPSLYAEFISDLQKEFKDYGYGWDKHKEASCDWILGALPKGVGVDVGGTTYLVKKIQETAQRDITYFDFYPPKDKEIKKYVAAEMSEFGNHFQTNTLDFITTRHTLEHSLNPLYQLWQYNRALKENATLIVIVPCHTKGWVWFYSHFNCLPRENWLMLFFRAGFRVIESTAGTWQPNNPDFIEYRFILKVEKRGIRLENGAYSDFRIG